ncbi:hypothetical protein pb186bvf_005108 [Paramecium bursaria]
MKLINRKLRNLISSATLSIILAISYYQFKNNQKNLYSNQKLIYDRDEIIEEQQIIVLSGQMKLNILKFNKKPMQTQFSLIKQLQF